MTKLMRTLLINKNGALIEAENQYGKVKFERDSLGRITKEWQGRHFFYDEEGKKVWERNLDIYGRVKTEEALGEKNLIPFRFQGQYEDEETGLKRGRPYSNAVSSKEVLVEGRVPANKLTITCPG